MYDAVKDSPFYKWFTARVREDVTKQVYEEGLTKGQESGIAKGREEGIVKGREEGKEEGRVEAMRQLLFSMVQQGFPTLLPFAQQRAQRTDNFLLLQHVILALNAAQHIEEAQQVLETLPPPSEK